MAERYNLTPSQAKALRALCNRIVESSFAEVAVSALLPPTETQKALAALEKEGLVNSWVAVTGRVGRIFVATDEGQAVGRAISHFGGIPPIGTTLPISGISGWFTRQGLPSHVQIVSEGN